MAAIVGQGRVIETRPGLIIIRLGAGPGEGTFGARPHEAKPGDYVWVYDDGQVEVVSSAALPSGVVERTLPTGAIGAPEPDHT